MMTNFSKIHFNAINLIIRALSTPSNRVLLSLHGIQVGMKCSFYGRTISYRHPASTIRIGENCTFRSHKLSNLIGIKQNCVISTHSASAAIEIGDNCGFSGTVIGAAKSITIHENVRCGSNTVITDFDWHINDRRSGNPKEIVIEENVWLGLNCVVLKGSRIGQNSLIGANSVVVSSIPPNVIAAGNPCRIIKDLGRNDHYV